MHHPIVLRAVRVVRIAALHEGIIQALGKCGIHAPQSPHLLRGNPQHFTCSLYVVAHSHDVNHAFSCDVWDGLPSLSAPPLSLPLGVLVCTWITPAAPLGGAVLWWALTFDHAHSLHLPR
jgi:hypothetical protein